MYRSAAAVFLIVLCLLLPACNQIEPGQTSNSKIEVWIDANPELLALLHQQVRTLPGIDRDFKVNFRVFRFEDLKPAILGSISNKGSEPPDLIMFSSDWLGELVGSNLIASISMPGHDYLPVASAAMHWADKCYGLPWSLDTVALIVNDKLVPRPPENFTELLALKNSLPAGIFPLIYDNKNFYYHAAWFHAFADGLFADDRLQLTSAGVARSLDFAYELEAVHGLVPPKANQAAAINLFAAGRAAMTINGPWAIPDFIRNKISFSVVPIPGPDSATLARPFVGVKGLAVTSFSPKPELAYQVALAISSSDFMEKVAAKSLFIPCFRSSGEKSQPWLQGFVRQAERGRLMPARPEMKFVWSEMNRVLRLRFLGQASATALLNQAQARINEAINQEKGDR